MDSSAKVSVMCSSLFGRHVWCAFCRRVWCAAPLALAPGDYCKGLLFTVLISCSQITDLVAKLSKVVLTKESKKDVSEDQVQQSMQYALRILASRWAPV